MTTAYMLQVNEKEEGLSKGDSFWASVAVFVHFEDALREMAQMVANNKCECRVIELVENGRRWALNVTEPPETKPDSTQQRIEQGNMVTMPDSDMDYWKNPEVAKRAESELGKKRLNCECYKSKFDAIGAYTQETGATILDLQDAARFITWLFQERKEEEQ